MSTSEEVSGEPTARPTYFQLVENEILQLLFRFTFNASSGLWCDNDEAVRKQVLHGMHPLSPAMKYVFKSLSISGEDAPALEFYMLDRFEDSRDLLKIGREATIDEVREAVAVMKDSVEVLEFSAMHQIEQDIQKCSQIVTTHCKNVVELRILDYEPLEVNQEAKRALGTIFNTFASRLQSLTCEVVSEYVSATHLASSLANECMRLKQLSLTGDYDDLEVFNILLAKSGDTLESLTLSLDIVLDGQWEDTFEVIRGESKKLSALHLEHPTSAGVSEEDYVAFLMHYGSRLVSVAPLKFSPNALRNLRKACPNLRLDLIIGQDEYGWDCLEAAGEIAGNVEMDSSGNYDYQRLSRVLANCPHLVRLSMCNTSDEPSAGLDSLISLRMFEMKKLSFRNFTYHACINVIEKCTSKLKELRVRTGDSIQNAEPIQRIASKMVFLEFVWIEDKVRKSNRRSRLRHGAVDKNNTVFTDIVRSFWQCEHMHSLRVFLHSPVDQDELRAVCLPFRTRGVNCLLFSCGKRLLEIDDFEYSERRIESQSDSDGPSWF